MQELKQKKHNKTIIKPIELTPIPDKLYFTIGEVSRLCQLKTHVLRYWEKEFMQLSPAKRRGNRRYYQRKDILIVRQIRNLLYEQGFTIEGARSKLIINETEIVNEPAVSSKNIGALLDELEYIVKELA